jgi:hypothetical protein
MLGLTVFPFLLARSCDEHPELPPTVEWQGLPLHATCANLWANCVRATPPTK